MKIKQIFSGILAAGMIACCAAAPNAAPVSGLVVEASAASAPKAPSSFKASSTAAESVQLKWSKVSGADGIEIYRATSKNGTFKKVKTVSGTKTGVKLTGLTAGKTYYFKVRAYKKSGDSKLYSDYTAVKSAKVMTLLEEQLKVLKEKSPIYAAFNEETVTFPVQLEIVSEYGGQKQSVAIAIESFEKTAMTIESGSDKVTFILNGSEYYIINHSEKSALKMDLGKDEKQQMLDSMLAAMQFQFDPEKASYSSSEKTYKGKKYLYEKIESAEGPVYEVYADTKTKQVKYLILDGEVSEVTTFSHKIDASMFKIPSGYEVVSMNDLVNSMYS